jgi:hypothetical protein
MTKKQLDSEKEKSKEIFFCQDSKNRKYGLSKKLKKVKRHAKANYAGIFLRFFF